MNGPIQRPASPQPAKRAAGNGTSENKAVVLHVIDVGQGTSVLIECCDEEGKAYFLFDGGKKLVVQKPSNLLRTIKSVCQNKLNGIIVSHTDYDHLGGIVRLLNEHTQDCTVLITKDFERHKKKKLVKAFFNCLKDQSVAGNQLAIQQRLHQSFHCFFEDNSPGLLCKAIEPTTKEHSIEEGTELDPNNASIILQVQQDGKIDVCLTGDAPGHRIVQCIPKGKPIQIFQVSHHGSRLNSVLVEKGYSQLLKRYAEFHTHCTIADMLESPDQPYSLNKPLKLQRKAWSQGSKKQANKFKKLTTKKIKITEKEKVTVTGWKKENEQRSGLFELDNDIPSVPKEVKKVAMKVASTSLYLIREHFLRQCGTLQCKRFYKHVQATTYVITSGQNRYGHPHNEVLNGIAEAAAEQKKKCQIVLTNSHGTENTSDLSDVFFTRKDLVSLWYLEGNQSDPSRPSCVKFDTLCKEFKQDRHMKRVTLKQKPSDSSKLAQQFYFGFQLLPNAETNKKLKQRGDPPLSQYLKIIGQEGKMSFHTLLTYVLGLPIVAQLSNEEASLSKQKNIDLKQFFEWDVKEESNFDLSPTGVAVSSGEIHLDLSHDAPLINSKRINALSFSIKRARTAELEVKANFTLEGEREPMIVHVGNKIDYRGSYGLPPAEYLAVIGIDIEECVSKASHMSVGEMIGLLLNPTRGIALMQSFTGFFSSNLISYTVDPMLTTIDFQQESTPVTVTEAHIIASIPKDSCLKVSDSFQLKVCTASLHLYPSFDESEQFVELEGEFLFKEHHIKMRATPKFSTPPEMEFTFTDELTVSETLEILECKTKLPSTELQVPFTNQKIQIGSKVSCGFTIHQPFLLVPQVSSIFINVDWFTNFPSFWPKCIRDCKKGSLRLSLVYPTESSTITLGIQASFSWELNLPTKAKVIILECLLAATPDLGEKEQFKCCFSLRPCQKPYESMESLSGAPILDIISAIDSNVGQALQSVLSRVWPELFQAIELTEISFDLLSSEEDESCKFKLDVGLDQLQLITDKLELSNARLVLEYYSGGIELNCDGELTFFNKYSTYVSFTLPTPDSPGEFIFENYDPDFTLECFISGIFTLGDRISSMPVLHDFLSVSIDSVDITFERHDSKTVITHAIVHLSKQELNLGTINLSGIKIAVSLDHSGSDYDIDFSLSGFIGDKLYAQLQYGHEDQSISVLSGKIILASFQEIDGTSALEQLQVEHGSLTESYSPLLGDVLGATAQLEVSIMITKNPIHFELVNLALNLSNILELEEFNLSVKQLCIKYEKSPDGSRTYKLFGSICNLDRDESAALEFVYNDGVIRATISSGDSDESAATSVGGMLKLSSLLDAIKSKPEIPELDESINFFDLELKTGSMSFETKPLSVTEFKANVMSHGELCIINEPKIVLSDIKLAVDWEKGNKVNGIVSANFQFSKFSIELICKRLENDTIFTAQINKDSESMDLNTGAEIQHIGQNKAFNDLIPEKLVNSQATPLAVAINATRKQFLFMMDTAIGSGVLFVGKSRDTKRKSRDTKRKSRDTKRKSRDTKRKSQDTKGKSRDTNKYGLLLAFSLKSGFKFEDLSKQLAYIDTVLTVRDANLAVSTIQDETISDFHDSITELTQDFQCPVPFTSIVSASDSGEQVLTAGASIFAEMDIHQAKDSLLLNIVKMQQTDSKKQLSNIAFKASILKNNVDIEAHIANITLLEQVTFENICLLFQLSKKKRFLELSGTMCLEIAASYKFDGTMIITESDATIDVKAPVSDEPLISPLGMNIKLTDLSLKGDFNFKGSPPAIEISGGINLRDQIDISAMVLFSGIVPNLVVIDITSELSIGSLLSCVGKRQPDTLADLKILNGHFHYARVNTSVSKWMAPKHLKCYEPNVSSRKDGSVVYKKGIHAKCDVQLFIEQLTFDIRLDVDFSSLFMKISGRSRKKIDLKYIKITDQEFKEGPCLSFERSSFDPGELKLEVGLEILGKPWFSGTLSYPVGREWLNGTVRYEGSFLWMEKPEIEVKIIPEPPFILITDFRFGRDQDRSSLCIFDLLKMLKKFCSWLLKLVGECVDQDFDLHLKTGTNPDPTRFSVALILSGTYKVVFFNEISVCIDLPELTILVPNGDTLDHLPSMVVDTLINAGEEIVNLICDYIHVNDLLEPLKEIVSQSLTVASTAAATVVDAEISVIEATAETAEFGAKTVVNAISGAFESIFGSIKIVSVTSGEVIAEVMGGRGAKQLHNEKQVVPLFASLIGIMGIHRLKTHICNQGRAAVDIPEHFTKGKVNTKEMEHMLEELRDDKYHKLDSRLKSLASIMLKVHRINILHMESNRIQLEWEVDPDVMKVDEGDFDYHIQILAYTIEPGTKQDEDRVVIQSHTLFDDVVCHRHDSTPFHQIVENDILCSASKVTVSIKAAITMNVKAYGITEDITIEGQWKNAELVLTKSSIDPPSTITMQFDALRQQISGSFTPVPGAQAYAVQLVDEKNYSRILQQVTVHQPPSVPTLHSVEYYHFDLNQISQYYDSFSACRVRAFSIGQDCSVSNFTQSERTCERIAPPVNVHFQLSHKDQKSVALYWECNPKSAPIKSFSVHLYAGRMSSDGDLQEIKTVKELSFDSTCTTYSHIFELSDTVEQLEQQKFDIHSSHIILKGHIVAHTIEYLLPSIPACSKECRILLPPPFVHWHYSRTHKLLYVGWQHVPDTLSYQVQLVNPNTSEVVWETIHYRTVTFSKQHNCRIAIDCESLKAAIPTENMTCKVEIFTRGHGRNYLGSFFPCVSRSFIQRLTKEEMSTAGFEFRLIDERRGAIQYPVRSIHVKYSPKKTFNESVCVSWRAPPFGARSYTVTANSKQHTTKDLELCLSPMELDIECAGEHTISIFPDSRKLSKCTFDFSAAEMFTKLCISKSTVTSLKVSYGLVADAPKEVNCYLVCVTATNEVIMSILLTRKNSTSIMLNNINPRIEYKLYALGVSSDCKIWAVPKMVTIKGSSVVPNEVNLLGTNLLGEPIAGEISGTISSASEDCWSLESWTPESNCDPPPMGQTVMYSTAKDIKVKRTQIVDLTQSGFTSSFLDEYQPQIRVTSWICAPQMTNSPLYYKMALKLLSEDKKILAKFYKGPLQLPPNGHWRKVVFSIKYYNPQLRYIEFTDSGLSEGDNTTKVAQTTIQLGRVPGVHVEAFSLPHQDSVSAGERTCLLFITLPQARKFFQKWSIECSRVDSESDEDPTKSIYPIGTYNRISLKIPTASVLIRIFAVGKYENQLKVGDVLIPAVDKPCTVLDSKSVFFEVKEIVDDNVSSSDQRSEGESTKEPAEERKPEQTDKQEDSGSKAAIQHASESSEARCD